MLDGVNLLKGSSPAPLAQRPSNIRRRTCWVRGSRRRKPADLLIALAEPCHRASFRNCAFCHDVSAFHHCQRPCVSRLKFFGAWKPIQADLRKSGPPKIDADISMAIHVFDHIFESQAHHVMSRPNSRTRRDRGFRSSPKAKHRTPRPTALCPRPCEN
jgi:hypothetical protein